MSQRGRVGVLLNTPLSRSNAMSAMSTSLSPSRAMAQVPPAAAAQAKTQRDPPDPPPCVLAHRSLAWSSTLRPSNTKAGLTMESYSFW